MGLFKDYNKRNPNEKCSDQFLTGQGCSKKPFVSGYVCLSTKLGTKTMSENILTYQGRHWPWRIGGAM